MTAEALPTLTCARCGATGALGFLPYESGKLCAYCISMQIEQLWFEDVRIRDLLAPPLTLATYEPDPSRQEILDRLEVLRDDWPAVLALTTPLLVSDPSLEVLLRHLAAMSALGLHAQATTLCRTQLALPRSDDLIDAAMQRVLLLDSLVTHLFLMQEAEFAQEADTLSAEALALWPGEPATEFARAAALLLNGQPATALILLRRVRTTLDTHIYRRIPRWAHRSYVAETASLTALALVDTGDIRSAASTLEQAPVVDLPAVALAHRRVAEVVRSLDSHEDLLARCVRCGLQGITGFIETIDGWLCRSCLDDPCREQRALRPDGSLITPAQIDDDPEGPDANSQAFTASALWIRPEDTVSALLKAISSEGDTDVPAPPT